VSAILKHYLLELGHEVLGFHTCLFGNAYDMKYVVEVEEQNVERMEFLHKVGKS
jgi:hypothetical protein